jgi:hypothetical protein
VEYVIAVLLGVIGSLIAAEIYSRANQLSRWLITHASAQLPERTRDRFHEEWIAHLDECERGVSQIFHAIGCLSTVTLNKSIFNEVRGSPLAEEIVANFIVLLARHKTFDEEHRRTLSPILESLDPKRAAELERLAQMWRCSTPVLLAVLLDWYENYCEHDNRNVLT